MNSWDPLLCFVDIFRVTRDFFCIFFNFLFNFIDSQTDFYMIAITEKNESNRREK